MLIVVCYFFIFYIKTLNLSVYKEFINILTM